MSKIISNKYIYVGLISISALLFIGWGIFSLVSNDIEGEWVYMPTIETIGSFDQLDKSNEQIDELKIVGARLTTDSLIFKFNNEQIYINEILVANWSMNDGVINFSSAIDSLDLKEGSPSMSVWDFSKKYYLDFKNDKTIMEMVNINDSTEVISFERR
tara:strand:+ start:70 stop:543 length:474 start_codon:yes stop_codon:yes gene_type:complete